MRLRRTHGQSIIEYAVLIAAVSLGVWAVANKVYKSFVGQAQEIEEKEYLF